jgi:hypothetical protein
VNRNDEAKADLQARYPDWQVWYVPRAIGGPLWCAQLRSTINTESSADLAAEIEATTQQLAIRLSSRLETSGDTPA